MKNIFLENNSTSLLYTLSGMLENLGGNVVTFSTTNLEEKLKDSVANSTTTTLSTNNPIMEEKVFTTTGNLPVYTEDMIVCGESFGIITDEETIQKYCYTNSLSYPAYLVYKEKNLQKAREKLKRILKQYKYQIDRGGGVEIFLHQLFTKSPK